jgi:membrane protein
VNEWMERARRFVSEEMWRGTDWWVRLLQFIWVIGEGFVRDQLMMRAHGLTYISLLSLIPLLALVVSIGSALGIQENLMAMVVSQIEPVAPQAAAWIQERIASIKFGSLGTIGAAILVVTTLLAIGNVENTFNHIWGVTKQRGWTRRIPDYLAVVVIVPLVLGVAISMATTLKSQAAVGALLDIPLFSAAWDSGLRQLPTAMYMLGFTFMYWFLPNTHVKALSALIGGVVAGIGFAGLQSVYVGAQVGVARYDFLFGSVAFLPLLIVFVYFSWAIVLLGAEVSFGYQNLARYRREVKGDVPGPAAREAIGLGIALEVARRFRDGAAGWTADSLADEFDIRVRTIREILQELEDAGIVSELADDDKTPPGTYQPGRPAEQIRVGDVLGALRGKREPLAPAIDRVFDELEKQQRAFAESSTLADLVNRP